MLHIAEAREPGAFAPPRGYARRTICATTGTIPDRSCESVVTEWLDGGDRLALRKAQTRVAALEIDSPRDGARYLPGGAILLRAGNVRGTRIRWSINGRSAGEGPTVPLRLLRGRYTIVAEAAGGAATTHVIVAEESTATRRTGFTITR